MGDFEIVTIVSLVIGVILALILRAMTELQNNKNSHTVLGFFIGAVLTWVIYGLHLALTWAASI